MVDWVVGCSMIMVGVGLVQFFFGYDIARNIRIPGLQYNAQISDIQVRSIFNRPRGTALHPIEYGVVQRPSSRSPTGGRAGSGRSERSSQSALCSSARWCRSAGLRSSASPSLESCCSSARPGSNASILVAATVGGIVVAGTLVNGLVGTIRSLFTGTEHDPSVQARLDRFPAVVELVAEYPWLGRGFGTYTPEDYFLLDNEIQKTAIESGLIGVAALVLFIVFVATVAWRARGTDESNRLLGTALAASILGIFISTYTFDAFFYKILMGLVYLCIGLVGAFWRLSTVDRVGSGLPKWSSGTRTLAHSAGRPAVTA